MTQKIEEIRLQWFNGRAFEFHFNSCSRDIRERFLAETAKFEYLYTSFVFSKAKLYGEGFHYKNSFYKYAVNLLFQNLKPYLKNATVIFDRCGNRDFQQELKKYLGRRVNEKGREQFVKKIKTNNSDTNNLLQLADMVCGAVARYLRKAKQDHLAYRKIISHRETVDEGLAALKPAIPFGHAHHTVTVRLNGQFQLLSCADERFRARAKCMRLILFGNAQVTRPPALPPTTPKFLPTTPPNTPPAPESAGQS